MKTNQHRILASEFSNARLIVLFVILLLSSLTMFGQNAQQVQTGLIKLETTVVASNDTNLTVTNNAAESNASMNMVSWFMGTKQTPKTELNANAQDSKKQMINSGIAPNRLLMKAFLKKASNYQSTIA